MKKRLLIVIALALVLVLALTLVACGGSTEQNPDSGTPSTPDGGQSPETPDGGEQTPETPDDGDEGETPTPPVTYTVTFETNGGSAVQPVTVDEGDAVAAAPETTLDGYEFDGWYFSADLSDDSLVTFPYTPADNITLYAKWSKILTAADLYNEVFGEDYAFVSFEEALQPLAIRVFSTTANVNANVNFLLSNLNETFTIYASGLRTNGELCMLYGEYIGNTTEIIKEYRSVSTSINDEHNFKDYIYEQIGYHADIPSVEVSNVTAQMQQIFANLENLQNSISALERSDFTTSRPITNTTTNIEFADYAAKFMPVGVTPIACYVRDLFGRYMESSKNPYFNTGYYDQFDACFVYIDTEGFLNIVKVRIVVPWYTNSTDESLYASALKEEGKNYKISRSTVTTIENPIWTGYTVGI